MMFQQSKVFIVLTIIVTLFNVSTNASPIPKQNNLAQKPMLASTNTFSLQSQKRIGGNPPNCQKLKQIDPAAHCGDRIASEKRLAGDCKRLKEINPYANC